MVMVEGQGRIPPASLDVVLQAGAMAALGIEARKRADYRRYGDRRDEWGRGLTGAIVNANIGTFDEATAPILAGLIGEHCVCDMIRRRVKVPANVDFTLRPDGDGGKDIVAFGLKIDIKTRTKDHGVHLVRHANERGRKAQLKSDVYVFATWPKGRVCHVHGFVWRDFIAALEPHDAIRGNHTNYEIQPADLLPMSRLFDEIRSRELWL